MQMYDKRNKSNSEIFISVVLLALGGIGGCTVAWPKYNVYQREMNGQAQLKEATWNRKIAIEEANAKLDSSKSLAEAEIERAKGVAEANKIIGESLKNNESYLRYLWIQGLQDNTSGNQVIYVPTEAGLPILEAGRAIQ